MGITVAPITERFAAEIGDVDLARPLSAEDAAAVKQAFWTYAVLIFTEQKLEAEQHLEFAKLFGPLFVYTHRWRVSDLVMWDNRCTMHRGLAFDDLRYERDMQRATVSDIANTCEQAGVLPS